jgi:hypothetical protein
VVPDETYCGAMMMNLNVFPLEENDVGKFPSLIILKGPLLNNFDSAAESSPVSLPP